MNKYIFLIAWAAGSESAWDNSDEATFEGDTKVHVQEDLLPQFIAGNANVFAVEITAPSMDIATAYGYMHAFGEDYTELNSTSIVYKLTDELASSLPEIETKVTARLEDE